MLFQNHYHLFQRSVARSFTQTIDGTFYLSCTIDHTGNRIGCCQSQIIMTMATQNGLVNIGDIINEVSDFFTILMRQAITRGIRNIDNCCSCLNHGFNYFSKIFIVGTACIFCIKLHIVHKVLCPFYGLCCSCQYFFSC